MFYDAIIIDSGYTGSKSISGVNLEYKTLNEEVDNITDKLGHGTKIINMIFDRFPQAKLFVIKVCNSYTLSSEVISNALEYIIKKNLRCNIINISLGSMEISDHQYLYGLIEKLNKRNMIVVASMHNVGMSFPAAYDNVIGVDVDNIGRKDTFICTNGRINIIGHDGFFRIRGMSGQIEMSKGSSYMTAYITGLLIEHYYKNCDNISNKIQETIDYLRSLADDTILFNHKLRKPYSKLLQETKRAVVFPFNKEIHAISANEDMVDFEIEGYYDFNISNNNNKVISEVLPYTSNNKIIQSIQKLDWEGDFDTFICGHCNEFEKISHKEVLREIVDKCKMYHKKIYSFDHFDTSYLEFFCPNIDKNNVPRDKFNKLFEFTKPILAVMGTSSVQGKYALQLKLRKHLTSRGYKIVNIGTEPSGYIFGFEYVVPIGYGSKMDLSSYELVTLVNEYVHLSEFLNPDLIVVGSQSGTVPQYYCNLNSTNFRQQELLFASAPDAVILCINSFDEINYIKRTINYLEAYSKAKVISLVLSPLYFSDYNVGMRNKHVILSDDVRKQFISELQSKISIPIFDADDMEGITNSVIKYFVE